MVKLHIGSKLSLPLDAVTQTFAVLGKRGSGKTTAATGMAEEMLKQGQPVVIYDPTSAWHGLKSSRDGKHPGFPVVIFGGDHADVPLEETAGATIATVIVERRIPAILDVGLLRKGARIRFMTDFCETLYHKNREAIHFFVDEAHTICPQRAAPETARLLGAMEDIVLQGRRRGLGVTVISQRPALVAKNITTQCEVMIAMQLTGSHDRKAVEEWVDAHGDDAEKGKEMMSSLAALQRGEAWVWSPSWLRIFLRTKFRDRETFDSSATPEVGGRVITPKTVAEVDLAALGDQIKATVEKAKADDPKALRAKIAELERNQKTAAPSYPDVRPQLERLQQYVDNRPKFPADALQAALDAIRTIAEWENKMGAPRPELRELATLTARRDALRAPAAKIATALRMPSDTTVNLGKCERAILTALAQLGGDQTKRKVALFSRYSVNSGGFNNSLAKLRSSGLMEGRGDSLSITESGMSALGSYEPLPTGLALREYWINYLGKCPSMILACLCEHYPTPISKDQLGELSQYSPNSGGFNNSLSELRTLELITGNGHSILAAKELFE